MPSGSIFIFCSHVIRVSAFQKILINIYTLCTLGVVVGYFHVTCTGRTASPGLEVWCGTDHSGWVLLVCRSLFLACMESEHLPLKQSHLYLPSPSKKRWHALVPGTAYRWVKKRRMAQSSNLHWCSSHDKFVSGGLGTRVPSDSINGQPVPFPAPLTGSCFKSLSDRSHSSCRDVSQQGLQASPVRELVTVDPMACSIAGRPCKRPSGIITCRQIWQLMPRLKHGRVESIDQLVWYHTQFNTPAEWRHQFCSSETRLDRYAVHPKWLTFRFCKPKKQSCSVEYLSFLIRIILDLIRWYPVRHTFDHRIEGISPPVFSISTVDL